MAQLAGLPRPSVRRAARRGAACRGACFRDEPRVSFSRFGGELKPGSL